MTPKLGKNKEIQTMPNEGPRSIIRSESVFIVSPIWLASNKTTRPNSQAYQNINEEIIKR